MIKKLKQFDLSSTYLFRQSQPDANFQHSNREKKLTSTSFNQCGIQ